MENIKNEIVKISIGLEEYIPLKVLIDRKDEPIKNISYSKDKNSLLEIAVGATSGFIKRITLLLCKEYDINESKLDIAVYEIGDLKVTAKLQNTCSHFKTYLYEDGVSIEISEEKVFKYIKMDRLYVGLSSLGGIAKICLCQLTSSEMNHIKTELVFQ
ncbi:MAG: hypothetical protein NC432_06305 [Roseburia sp.]|nr:hypothetical protein [Roseburia sp.]MCM1097631.1 hypothetical protein [Ruminococcus flavefaciens]